MEEIMMKETQNEELAKARSALECLTHVCMSLNVSLGVNHPGPAVQIRDLRREIRDALGPLVGDQPQDLSVYVYLEFFNESHDGKTMDLRLSKMDAWGIHGRRSLYNF